MAAVGQLLVSSNVPHGMKVGALPDGRYANSPLADTTSPMHGTDRNGYGGAEIGQQASLHAGGGRTALNMRLNPTSIQKEGGKEKLVYMLRTFLGDLKGMHIQFNMINSETLRDAQ